MVSKETEKVDRLSADMLDKRATFRTVSTEKYIMAGIITFLVLSLGITLGVMLEGYRYSQVEEVNRKQDVDYLSLQLQYIYLTSFSNHNNCGILSATLKQAVKDLSESLSKVVGYEEEQKSMDGRKMLTLRRYALDNLRYYLLARQGKESCDLEIVTVLYFYSIECPSCPTQGTILSYFKQIFGEKLLVFPINLDLRDEEPMIEIAMQQFNVTKYPTLVIDEHKYEGVVRKEQLQEIFCRSIPDKEYCLDNLGRSENSHATTIPELSQEQ